MCDCPSVRCWLSASIMIAWQQAVMAMSNHLLVGLKRHQKLQPAVCVTGASSYLCSHRAALNESPRLVMGTRVVIP